MEGQGRKGLVTQQREILLKNDQTSSNTTMGNICNTSVSTTLPLTPTPSQSELQSAPPPTSRHSPPASRPRASLRREDLGELEGLEKLGDVWRNREKWDGFKSWLRGQSEGEDSEGKPLSLERLAIFLELYVGLDQQFRSQPDSEHCLNMVLEIANHQEDFFGRERCLRCLDTAMRKTVLLNVKNVKEGKESPSPAVFAIVYQRVVDRLLQLLGSYQNYLLEKQKCP